MHCYPPKRSKLRTINVLGNQTCKQHFDPEFGHNEVLLICVSEDMEHMSSVLLLIKYLFSTMMLNRSTTESGRERESSRPPPEKVLLHKQGKTMPSCQQQTCRAIHMTFQWQLHANDFMHCN